jgi:hypothetical protein
LKPFGVVTACVALSWLHPSRSPLWFNGCTTCEANLPPSSSTASRVASSMSAWRGIALKTSTTPSTSCRTKRMSRSGGV